ncbi:uncharacterized protein LACBIDRAFT_303103 [Laccaria bicolor S238N-H82]|uniref:Predicted protein n=1 Tax=Laccaria bicolor (strain S238N-H82 / ATCC MYA-4686) TaxID=486041 RepID=B0DIY1_LACBS|nr:uncharacterized protein LACBIDRAFT_303103 [Laccaria bicolor S238N-H82]EDR05311.1 predicted protein [Laccaria bicolor S238N-H82]|eukprot:XP_001883869.1 predicted protein [Laccaria bicolor S238N-H82]
MDLALLHDEGKPITWNAADSSDTDLSSLHLHFVTTRHSYGRFFSSPAPGFAMGVGSIGGIFLLSKESNTSISTDAGVTWRMARPE